MQARGLQALSGTIVEHTPCLLYLSIGRRSAALGYSGTEFHTVGTTHLSCNATLYAICTDFKFHISTF